MTESPDRQQPQTQTEDQPPGPMVRVLYAVMVLLGAWGLVRWLLAGAKLQGDATFGAGYQYLTVGLMLLLIGCGCFGLWRARKVLMPPKKKKKKNS